MIKIALMGAGRIGKMHANLIMANSNCSLEFVYDVNTKFAEEISKQTGAKIAKSPEDAINSENTDAVFIASATPTHVSFITMAVNAKKPVFCEKPIDLDINKVDECREFIKDNNTHIQIGFNRRFDKSHSKVKIASNDNEIGKLEMLVISSRDPEPPGIDYLKAAGGFFRDTTIHDFDLSRFILGDDPIEKISAFGEQLISEDAKKVGDHDTAMFIMRSKSGVLIHINNSRRAVYGYDQRVEAFGSKGMIISNNQTQSSVEKYTKDHTFAKDPVQFFFIERYEQAYKSQLEEFLSMITNKSQPKVTFEDGRRALIIANAAYESFNSGKVVDIKF
ncbi:inositol 2-dehydrogenase [Pelagibacteraceae bacterium]|nr:inositol 2-dehydrogenase [Pelagibacteraceae bacterium]